MSTASLIPTTVPQARAAAQALEDKLANANPTNLADCQAVTAALEAVGALLTQLNQEDMLSRDAAFQAVAADIKEPLQKLSGLYGQLAELSKHLTMPAGIAGDIDQVVKGCTTIFAC